MIIVNDPRSAELAIYHFISNVHSRVGYDMETWKACASFLFLFYASFLYLGSVSNETIIPLAHVEYDMIIVNDARSAELAIYHFISNVHSQNNC